MSSSFFRLVTIRKGSSPVNDLQVDDLVLLKNVGVSLLAVNVDIGRIGSHRHGLDNTVISIRGRLVKD